MIQGMRSGLAGSVALVALVAAVWLGQSACSDKTRTLTCGQTVASACGTAGACVTTWDAAQTDTAWCAGATATSPIRDDCGGFHAVTMKVGDDSRTYYYDASVDAATSGMLIAVITAHSAAATTICDIGPATGFTLPTCSGMGSEPLPQCQQDGGADGATD